MAHAPGLAWGKSQLTNRGTLRCIFVPGRYDPAGMDVFRVHEVSPGKFFRLRIYFLPKENTECLWEVVSAFCVVLLEVRVPITNTAFGKVYVVARKFPKYVQLDDAIAFRGMPSMSWTTRYGKCFFGSNWQLVFKHRKWRYVSPIGHWALWRINLTERSARGCWQVCRLLFTLPWIGVLLRIRDGRQRVLEQIRRILLLLSSPWTFSGQDGSTSAKGKTVVVTLWWILWWRRWQRPTDDESEKLMLVRPVPCGRHAVISPSYLDCVGDNLLRNCTSNEKQAIRQLHATGRNCTEKVGEVAGNDRASWISTPVLEWFDVLCNLPYASLDYER